MILTAEAITSAALDHTSARVLRSRTLRRGRVTRALRAHAAVWGRRVRTGAAWLDLLAQDWDLDLLYAPRRTRLLALADHLRATAWHDATVAPGHQELADRFGVSLTTVARDVAWMQQRRWLLLVEAGSTAAARSASVDVDGNRRQVYLLTVDAHHVALAPVDEVGGPPPEGWAEQMGTPTRAGAHGELPAPEDGGWSPFAVTADRAQRVRAARCLIRRCDWLAGVNPRGLARVLGPFLRAGWVVRDAEVALERPPGGEPYWHSAAARFPLSLARARLAAWRGHPGAWSAAPTSSAVPPATPAPSPRAAAAAASHIPTGTPPPAGWASRVRAALRSPDHPPLP